MKKPNVRVRRSEESGPMTEADIRGMICNPIYAGVGPYEALVPEEQWVKVMARMIKTDGPEQVLVNMLHVLRHSFSNETDVETNRRVMTEMLSQVGLRNREQQ